MNWKKSVGIVLLTIGVIIACSTLVVGTFSLATLTVVVEDEMNNGIPGAEVYYFDGGGWIEPPTNGTLIGVTDSSGSVSIALDGFYRIGIIKTGYVCSLVQPQQSPPSEWADVWTAWGACGVNFDLIYPFVLVEGNVPVVPDPVPMEPIDQINDPNTINILGFGVHLTVLVGAVVACCGVPFLAWDKFGESS